MPTGLIIAAAMHDVGHPGSNNHFLVATSAPLAIQVTRTAEPCLLSLSPASLPHISRHPGDTHCRALYRPCRDSLCNFCGRPVVYYLSSNHISQPLHALPHLSLPRLSIPRLFRSPVQRPFPPGKHALGHGLLPHAKAGQQLRRRPDALHEKRTAVYTASLCIPSSALLFPSPLALFAPFPMAIAACNIPS